jgi:hypothetical protein
VELIATIANFLTVTDVLARYQLQDRRSARRVMDEAGSFKVAGRLAVSESDDLQSWEERQKERRVEHVPTARRCIHQAGAPEPNPHSRPGAAGAAAAGVVAGRCVVAATAVYAGH